MAKNSFSQFPGRFTALIEDAILPQKSTAPKVQNATLFSFGWFNQYFLSNLRPGEEARLTFELIL